ncbi:MAG TPA: hypothetical protein PK867_26365, partial [Pirellulales bacterium]|nr:hypothetical protein [Pirellulales bacterium]
MREADLFKTLRAETPDKAGVFRLLRQMEEDLDVYAALSDPEDALWNDAERRPIRELRLFGVRQPWPFLLAARRAFDAGDFAELLRACSIVSLRYNVIGGMRQATSLWRISQLDWTPLVPAGDFGQNRSRPFRETAGNRTPLGRLDEIALHNHSHRPAPGHGGHRRRRAGYA